MSKIRSRLESYVVRNTGELLGDLQDDHREDLADQLQDLEGYSSRTAAAETQADELVEKLESRSVVLAKLRTRVEELEGDLARARTELGDREQRLTELIEAERVRTAEREQQLRSELGARQDEIERQAKLITAREAELAEREDHLERRRSELAAYAARCRSDH